jgi:Flp pilus assembly pilin Flp
MKNKRAQSFVEYAALIAIIVAAIVAIVSYMGRSISGRYRDSADVYGGGTQYDPSVTTVN